ncbi:hypothetical protein TWF694_010623 [Orbilia ellipsospora]|uniref:Uncharacterized protein n=1 Tax=Orbilia ellipsospora TaxID=2528407 RepID=A0AAV9XAY4_9PEZI
MLGFDLNYIDTDQIQFIEPRALNPHDETGVFHNIHSEAAGLHHPHPLAQTIDPPFMVPVQNDGFWNNTNHLITTDISPLVDGSSLYHPEQDSEEQSLISSEWINTVTELNARLYTQYKASKSSRNKAKRCGRPGAVSGQVAQEPFPVDQTFVLSQQLLDIYNQVRPSTGYGYSFSTRVSTEDTSLDGRVTKSTGSTRNVNRFEEMPKRFPIPQDSGSLLLLLSCRVRLLYIYQNLLTHIQHNIREGKPSQPYESPSHGQVHALRMGEFSLEASPKLQAAITLQAMEYFLGHLQEEGPAETQKIPTKPSQNSSEILQDHIADITLREIQNIEAETLVAIRRVKCLVS